MLIRIIFSLFLLNLSVFAPLPPPPTTEALRIEYIIQQERQLGFSITELLDQYQKALRDFPDVTKEPGLFSLGFFFTMEAIWILEKFHLYELIESYKPVHEKARSTVLALEEIAKELREKKRTAPQEEIIKLKEQHSQYKKLSDMTLLEFSAFQSCLYIKDSFKENAPLKDFLVEIALDGMSVIYHYARTDDPKKAQALESLKNKYQHVVAYLQKLITPIKHIEPEAPARCATPSHRRTKSLSLKRVRPLSPALGLEP